MAKNLKFCQSVEISPNSRHTGTEEENEETFMFYPVPCDFSDVLTERILEQTLKKISLLADSWITSFRL